MKRNTVPTRVKMIAFHPHRCNGMHKNEKKKPPLEQEAAYQTERRSCQPVSTADGPHRVQHFNRSRSGRYHYYYYYYWSRRLKVLWADSQAQPISLAWSLGNHRRDSHERRDDVACATASCSRKVSFSTSWRHVRLLFAYSHRCWYVVKFAMESRLSRGPRECRRENFTTPSSLVSQAKRSMRGWCTGLSRRKC